MFSFEEDAIGPGATLKGEKNGCWDSPRKRPPAESMETTADSEEEDDDEEEKKLEQLVNESKHRGVTSDMNNTLNALLDKSVKVGAKRKRNHMSGLMPNDITGREFLLRLREVEITGKVIDLAFLDGYLEPTLMVLHEENDKNSTCGRLAVGFDTYCLTVISINMKTRLHPKIWTVKNLPSDCFRLIPCRAPLGGVVVLSANAILYFNQTQFHGLATNVFASKTHETAQLNVVLYDCQFEYLQEKELLLTMPCGQVYVLSLPYEDTSSRGLYGFGGKQTLFIGSRSGDSVLFVLDKKKLVTATEEEPKDEEMPIKEVVIKQESAPEIKSEPAEEEEEDEDDLFLYGAAPTKEEPAATSSTECTNGVGVSSVKTEENGAPEQDTGPYDYELRQIDVLPSIGQITSIELGVENNADSNEKREELVISGGYERSGAISVLHNGLRPIVGTEAELNGCRAMWTVSSSLPSATRSSDGRSYNAL
ncbi:uncharacterized protein PITG_18566 [Phytophthora infestans T30-4]|uniref:Uncharacterized protein n=1 Tax=Phytophthora infestans (strain T30-4) TaxID=403677 RepID=D0NYC4_PHYIT|nr:uncharacterized protein PITG_18566 [Phytophthora infestans T30-4]EEY68113.1 conserved hypothetical protein [Phytophthora infestans T30-4]|eukprot:XP_002997671.1 conserved hypothetical protein [Phytophthora infestans T30-4]